MLIDFTEFELETISAAMEDYINYDDELLEEDELIGGLSVANRVESIQDKIYKILVNFMQKINQKWTQKKVSQSCKFFVIFDLFLYSI